MKRSLKTTAILLVVAIVVLIWWANRSDFLNRFHQPPAAASAVKQAIADPVAFAENHFKGGIGVMLEVDSQTGKARIMQVVTGSPAEKAGLLKGDVITKINGTSTTGRKLAQVVDDMRGFVGGGVTLTIQRAGSTNLEMTLHRKSWSGLGVPYPTPASNGPGPVLSSPTLMPPASNNPTR